MVQLLLLLARLLVLGEVHAVTRDCVELVLADIQQRPLEADGLAAIRVGELRDRLRQLVHQVGVCLAPVRLRQSLLHDRRNNNLELIGALDLDFDDPRRDGREVVRRQLVQRRLHLPLQVLVAVELVLRDPVGVRRGRRQHLLRRAPLEAPAVTAIAAVAPAVASAVAVSSVRGPCTAELASVEAIVRSIVTVTTIAIIAVSTVATVPIISVSAVATIAIATAAATAGALARCGVHPAGAVCALILGGPDLTDDPGRLGAELPEHQEHDEAVTGLLGPDLAGAGVHVPPRGARRRGCADGLHAPGSSAALGVILRGGPVPARVLIIRAVSGRPRRGLTLGCGLRSRPGILRLLVRALRSPGGGLGCGLGRGLGLRLGTLLLCLRGRRIFLPLVVRPAGALVRVTVTVVIVVILVLRLLLGGLRGLGGGSLLLCGLALALRLLTGLIVLALLLSLLLACILSVLLGLLACLLLCLLGLALVLTLGLLGLLRLLGLLLLARLLGLALLPGGLLGLALLPGGLLSLALPLGVLGIALGLLLGLALAALILLLLALGLLGGKALLLLAALGLLLLPTLAIQALLLGPALGLLGLTALPLGLLSLATDLLLCLPGLALLSLAGPCGPRASTLALAASAAFFRRSSSRRASASASC
eukprot:SRR837773.19559.p1 GENE.SRR837773.19559~~SRR837773.19559.p1  ORF type:complete len:650 (+),score=212.93 SRR837773.19559:1294-3243(+)